MSYRVRNWERFQHYKDRSPPWIKLHFELLSSETWVMLDDASRVLAIACMLIASRNEGVVPDNPEYMKRVAYLNKAPNFKPLIDTGFLESASGVLADASNLLADARPEERREEESREKSRSAPAPKGTRIPEDWKPGPDAISVPADFSLQGEAEKFRDYWLAQPGQKGVKVDWQATWRNWVRRAVSDGRYAKSSGGIKWQ